MTSQSTGPIITFLAPLPGEEENFFTGFNATLSSKAKPKSDKSSSDVRSVRKMRDYFVGDFVLLEARDSVPITVAEILRVWEETESKSKLVSVCIYYPVGEDVICSDKCEEVLALDKLAVLECDQLFLNERELETVHVRGGRKRKLALLTAKRIVPDRNIPVIVVTREQYDNYNQLKQSHGSQFEVVCSESDTQKSLDLTHSQLLAPIFLFCSRIVPNSAIESALKCSNAISCEPPKSSLISKLSRTGSPITSHQPPYDLRSLSPTKSSQQGGEGKKDFVKEPASPPIRRSERISDNLSPTKHSETTKPVSPLKHSSPPTSPLKRRKSDVLPDLPSPLSPSRTPKPEPTSSSLTTPPNSPTKHSMCLRNSPKSPAPTTPQKSDSAEVFKTPRKRYSIPTPPPKRTRLEIVMPDKANFTSLAELFDYDDDIRIRARSRSFIPATSPSRCRESAYTSPHLDLSCDEELTLL